MKKNTMKSNISAIRRLSTKMPKSINEAINFNEMPCEDDMDMMDDDEEPIDVDMPSEKRAIAPSEKEGIGIENFITTMRKQSLEIMGKLADNPDDAVYDFAKKIFQLAEKAHQDQKEGKSISVNPQQENKPQRPM